jgi:hypothetical protein
MIGNWECESYSAKTKEPGKYQWNFRIVLSAPDGFERRTVPLTVADRGIIEKVHTQG